MLLTLERRMTALLSQQSAHADRQLLLAKVRLMLNDLDGAMAAIEPALKVNPRLIPAHRLIARIQAKKGNTHQALATLHQLIKQGLAWPDLHYQIAELEHQIGASANARSHLYSAVRLNPQFHDAKALLERMAA